VARSIGWNKMWRRKYRLRYLFASGGRVGAVRSRRSAHGTDTRGRRDGSLRVVDGRGERRRRTRHPRQGAAARVVRRRRVVRDRIVVRGTIANDRGVGQRRQDGGVSHARILAGQQHARVLNRRRCLEKSVVDNANFALTVCKTNRSAMIISSFFPRVISLWNRWDLPEQHYFLARKNKIQSWFPVETVSITLSVAYAIRYDAKTV